MAENNTTNEVVATEIAGAATEEKFTLFGTKTEAEANKPVDATKNHKVFEAAKSGESVGFFWARGYDHALSLLARNDGWSVSLGARGARPITQEMIAERLAQFTDEELAAMGLSRKKTKKPT